MSDHEPLYMPPERDVSPELRARVLERALSADVAVRRRPRWAMPVAAGLAAAAVVFGVLVVVGGGSDEPVGPTSPNESAPPTQLVADHSYVKVDAGKMSDDVQSQARAACQAARPPDGPAGHLMASRRFHTPDGLIGVIAYDNPDSKAPYQQYFCTPWGVTENPDPELIAAPDSPVEPIEGARVQGMLPDPSGRGGGTYYDGAWFVTTSEVDAVEARIVVDGVPGEWYRARRNSDYMYASVWQRLSPDQLDSDVEVEYRALNPDRALIEVLGLSSVPVIPAEQPSLTEQIEIPTRGD